MKQIVLLMCGAHKRAEKSKARDLYTSPRFQVSLRYAEYLTQDDNIFILSAMHHLLTLDELVEPYNKSLYEMPGRELFDWAAQTLKQLEEHCDIDDCFTFLTDTYYSKALIPFMKYVSLPLEYIPENMHQGWVESMLKNMGEVK
jgi:hypothetical protein